jgi:hypothetical protein
MRKEFRDVGRAAIADVLLRAEVQRGLDSAPIKEDWYRYLFNKVLVLRSPEHYLSQARKLTIVTFNFDRSFERALYSRLLSSFAITEKEARQLTTELRLHHVHSELGEPDWLYPESVDATAYGVQGMQPEQFLSAIRKAVRRIKIVDEDIPQSDKEDVAEVLNKAAYVYFVGFGFDERNMRKLGIPDSLISRSPTKSPPLVRANCFGWSNAELGPLRASFDSQAYSVHQDVDAIGFFQHYAEAIFQ